MAARLSARFVETKLLPSCGRPLLTRIVFNGLMSRSSNIRERRLRNCSTAGPRSSNAGSCVSDSDQGLATTLLKSSESPPSRGTERSRYVSAKLGSAKVGSAKIGPAARSSFSATAAGCTHRSADRILRYSRLWFASLQLPLGFCLLECFVNSAHRSCLPGSLCQKLR